MKRSTRTVLAGGVGLVLAGALLGGCTAIKKEDAHRKENLLAAAGFQMRLPDTPEKLAKFQAMTPNKLIAHSRPDGTIAYTYADPLECKCLYIGGAPQYARYRELKQQQQVAQAQEDAAFAEEDTAMDWGMWGPWGPW